MLKRTPRTHATCRPRTPKPTTLDATNIIQCSKLITSQGIVLKCKQPASTYTKDIPRCSSHPLFLPCSAVLTDNQSNTVKQCGQVSTLNMYGRHRCPKHPVRDEHIRCHLLTQTEINLVKTIRCTEFPIRLSLYTLFPT